MLPTHQPQLSQELSTPTLPLLNRTANIPFDSFKPEEIQPSIDKALKLAEGELETVKQVEGPRTFENTIRALDNLGLTLGYAMGIVSHLESVATTPAWRAEYNAVLPRVSEFNSKLLLDDGAVERDQGVCRHT